MAAFKRSLFGYRRDQVDAELAARDQHFADRERELLLLSEMVVAREREADTLREQLRDAHARHDRSLRSLEILATKLDELHAQARGQATRIRMKALSEAVQVSERAGDALSAIRELEATGRNGNSARTAEIADAAGTATAPPLADELAAAEDLHGAEPVVSVSPPAAEPVPAVVGPAEENAFPPLGYVQGDIEVEIGPLADFAQLLGFESAAERIPGAADISVRRFAAGRATLGMRLAEPVELLRELERHSPFGFTVRQSGQGQLILDLKP